MSDAARLARQSFSSKPAGLQYSQFKLGTGDLVEIRSKLKDAASDSAYAAVVSYAESLSSLQQGSISWSIVRLYYSCFYSIRTLLLINQVVPFNYKSEMLLDTHSADFIKGGKSSHHWEWGSIRKITRLSNIWFFSIDSQESYEKLREHRENVNYTHAFTDPNLHYCLEYGGSDIEKRLKSYRDDSEFFYTYLPDHLAVAYPTKLLFTLDELMSSLSINLEPEKISHIKRVWRFRSRCPLT